MRTIVSVALACVAAVAMAVPAQAARLTLVPFADLSAQRVQIADLVAAAKFGTPAPIDDPAREQVVLDTVARKAIEIGVDPDDATRVFRDQIEANKIVQRGLYVRWTVDPSLAPVERPDLVTVVRPRLDRITEQLLVQLRDTERLRESPSCFGHLIAAYHRAGRDLDSLHRSGLARALTSVCAPKRDLDVLASSLS
jgi:chorismate mutase